MNTTNDGQFQKYSVESGAYIREHFFGPDPRLRRLVEHLTDDDLRKLPRGGHDYRKLYAAYKAATEHEGSPTVILAHTIKGWTLGPEFEARNATHQIKKMTEAELKTFRDRLFLDIPDKVLEEGDPPYYHPGPKSEELEYMRSRRRALDGPHPERVVRKASLPAPAGDPFKDLLSGTGEKVKASTTSAFTRLMRNLIKDRQIGKRIVPIIPDEGRTFGLDALFATSKIYAPFGQQYEPVDAQLVLSYREDRTGQILEEGITEAGSMASFTAAGTAYATWGQPMIPFYIFYSMFGFQRVGDLIWAFGDARGRGFLLGATAGRTTLQGEGLQHDDGHSPVLASTVPNCKVYDPAFAYELAVIIEDGIHRMYGENPEDCFYYITLYNETMSMPAMPDGAKDGILRGLYRYKPAPEGEFANRSRIIASGSAMLAALEAQQLLAEHHDTAAEVWSATSYKLLRENALAVERWNRLHPTEVPRAPYISHVLGAAGNGGPTVAVTDYMKVVPDQVARWVPGAFIPLGTDGYGFSDTRAALRRHFETDAPHIVVAALSGLAQLGDVKGETVAEAIRRYDLDPETVDPREA
jgi:pyruvate dehydrogenase E1 component